MAFNISRFIKQQFSKFFTNSPVKELDEDIGKDVDYLIAKLLVLYRGALSYTEAKTLSTPELVKLYRLVKRIERSGI